jgi:SAM-dependent methyltransferase
VTARLVSAATPPRMSTLAAASNSCRRGSRRIAESFGSDPGRYDRSRSPYPDALIEHIVAAAPDPAFLDAGCGTGIEARQFRAAGRTVLGVEPRLPDG